MIQENEQRPLMEPLKGRNGTLMIYNDYVEINRTSSKFFSLIGGLYGIKRIYYREIGSVQFKKSGIAMGWIQFSILGGRDTGGIMKTGSSENAITFGRHNDKWEKAYDLVSQSIDNYKLKMLQQTHPNITVQPSKLEELSKAGTLLEKGLITKEEYEKIKAELLE